MTKVYNPLVFSGFDEAGAGGGGGTVTSVAGGTGISNTPDPIVGAGSVNLDIFNKLAAEATLASGDWFPFVDVSVGTTVASQRRATLADLTTFFSTVFQPLDGDLTALATVLGNGVPFRTAPNTWSIFSGTSGEVCFWHTSGLFIDSDPELFWDTTNKRLSIGGSENTITINGTTVGIDLGVHDEAAINHVQIGAHKHSDTGSANAVYVFARSRGTEAGETVVADNDLVGQVLYVAFDGVDYALCARTIVEIDEPTPGVAAMGSTFVIETTPRGAVTPSTRFHLGTDRAQLLGSSLTTGSRRIDFNDLANITIDGIRSGSTMYGVDLSVTNAGGVITAMETGSKNLSANTWTITTSLVSGFGAGGRIFTFIPVVKNSSGVAIADMGTWSAFEFAPTFQADAEACTLPFVRPFRDNTSFNIIAGGTLDVTEYSTVHSEPSIGAGVEVDTRRGLRYRNRASTGIQFTSIGLDVEDQTVSLLAAALRTTMTAGAGKWGVLATGGADNLFSGGVQVSYAIDTTTVATGRFEYHAKRLVLTGSQRLTLEGDARFVLAD